MRRLITTLILCLIISVGVGQTTYAQSPTPTPTPAPDDSGWLPDFPDTTELTQTMLSVLVDIISEAIRDELLFWVTSLKNTVLDWIVENWALDGGGLLGTSLRLIFNVSLGVAAPFIGLAISLTFFQQWLVRVFPGLVRSLTLSQMMGRVLVAALLVNSYTLNVMIETVKVTNRMAFTMFSGGPSLGFMAEWSWLENLFTVAIVNPNSIFYFIFTLFTTLIVMLLFVVSLFIKQFLNAIIIGVLPLAVTAWLFPLTDGLWSKYWWMFIKLAIIPFLWALMARTLVVILALMGQSVIIGIIMVLIVQAIGIWLILKFLFMPETLLIGAGAILTATGAGAPAGLSMIGSGVARGIGRFSKSGERSARQVAQTAGRVANLNKTSFPES